METYGEANQNGVLLPVDILSYIFGHLTPPDAFWASIVCRFWYACFTRDKLLSAQVFANRRKDHPRTLQYYAARCGYLCQLQWFADKLLLRKYVENVCACAAFGGHLNILEWLFASPGLFDAELADRIFLNAAHRGHLYVFEWMFSKLVAKSLDVDLLQEIAVRAACCGHLCVLQWMRARKLFKSTWWIASTAANAKYSGKYIQCEEEPARNATSSPLQIVQWLHKEGAFLTSDTFCAALQRDDLELAQWIYVCPSNGITAWNFLLPVILAQYKLSERMRIWITSLPEVLQPNLQQELPEFVP